MKNFITLSLILCLCLMSNMTVFADDILTTDDTGEAIFNDLSAGTYDIVVSKSGYSQSTGTATITAQEGGENVTVTVTLNKFINRIPSGKNKPYNTDEQANRAFTHEDYISMFEHLNLTFDDIYEPITRAETANTFAELFEMEHKNGGLNFHDVSGEEWHYPHIDDVSRKEIMIGYTDGTFRPFKNITRAEAAAVIVRTMGYEDMGNIKFHDTENHWACDYISKITANGVMIGDTEGTFRPDETITRAEVIIIVNRLMGLA